MVKHWRGSLSQPVHRKEAEKVWYPFHCGECGRKTASQRGPSALKGLLCRDCGGFLEPGTALDAIRKADEKAAKEALRLANLPPSYVPGSSYPQATSDAILRLEKKARRYLQKKSSKKPNKTLDATPLHREP